MKLKQFIEKLQSYDPELNVLFIGVIESNMSRYASCALDEPDFELVDASRCLVFNPFDGERPIGVDTLIIRTEGEEADREEWDDFDDE